MPTGTGAVRLTTLPPENFTSDPPLFFSATEKNEATFQQVPFPGFGALVEQTLPQWGVISAVKAKLEGTVTITTAAPTVTPGWPYNLIGPNAIKGNGQTGLFDCQGMDLRALQLARYPAFVDATDVLPDMTTTGTKVISLTWEWPIAMDEMSLVGSVFAQSASTILLFQLRIAQLTDMFSANGANVAINATISLETVSFRIPYAPDGTLLIPDLSKLHGFIANDKGGIVNTGDIPFSLIRSEGTMVRLFNRVTNGPYPSGTPLSIYPATAASAKIDRWRLSYGGNETPYDYTPASFLATQNNKDYGQPLPFGVFCKDFVREYPQRDVVYLQGVTELKAIPTVDAAVTPGGGGLNYHVVQETLF